MESPESGHVTQVQTKWIKIQADEIADNVMKRVDVT
jgi:hypothetical protein